VPFRSPEIPSEFLMIPSYKHFSIEVAGLDKALNVVPVSLVITFELSQCQVVSL
jgi:hypothetical protein